MSCSVAELSIEIPARDAAVDPTALPEPVRKALVERAVLRCAETGYRRGAIFGAGRHTRWMGTGPWSDRGVEIVAILEPRDAAAPTWVGEILAALEDEGVDAVGGDGGWTIKPQVAPVVKE